MSNTIKDKLRHYCRYQPRTHQDMRRKLYDGFSLRRYEVETLLAEMIEEGLVPDEKFAKSFARYRQKPNGWGSSKNAQTLNQRDISEYCINASLTAINQQVYDNTLEKLASEKWALGKGTSAAKQQKTVNHLLPRGYTLGEAWTVVRQLQ